MDPKLPNAAPPSDGKVAIWCPAEQLGDFITGLLGKPQTIRRSIRGDFIIGRDDLIGLHHLIGQRVREQNEAQLVQFVATIYYDDGLAVDVSSIEEFQKYAEVRALTTRRISLSWIYLIKFHGRGLPERQQIEVTFGTEPGFPNTLDYFESKWRTLLPELTHRSPGAGIRIHHTLRSWGMDVESLLTDHINVFLAGKKSQIPRLMEQFSGTMGVITFFAIMSVLLSSGVHLLRRMTKAYAVSDLPDGSSLGDVIHAVASKVDRLYSFLGGGQAVTLAVWPISYIIIAIVISVLVAIAITDGATDRYPSFILFTTRDDNRRDEMMRRYNNVWRRTLCGFLGGIAAGVAANAVTLVLW